MTDLDLHVVKQSRAGFSRRKKFLLRIDMTPMVDLGFLLITFFIFTTAISTPSVTKLIMPKDSVIHDSLLLPDELALTLLLGGERKIYFYHGNWEDAEFSNKIFETNYSYRDGLGDVIRQKQKVIDDAGKFKEGENGLMLLIKPAEKATYQEIMDALDEVLINDVRKYAILELQPSELKWLEKNTQGLSSSK